MSREHFSGQFYSLAEENSLMNIFKLICDNQVLSSHFPFHYGARADSGQSLLLNARMRLMGRCEVVPGDGTSSLLAFQWSEVWPHTTTDSTVVKCKLLPGYQVSLIESFFIRKYSTVKSFIWRLYLLILFLPIPDDRLLTSNFSK